VSIIDFAFSPSTLTIAPGNTVTWTNHGATAHTVTADAGAFGSAALLPGQTFSFTFSTPGTFSYHCSIHPFMTASVVVQTAATTAAPTTAVRPPTTASPGAGTPAPAVSSTAAPATTHAVVRATPLPATGADEFPLVATALAGCGVGGAMVALTRRRGRR
jgi:hypothetical protein